MDKQEAIRRGFVFTGIYERSKDVAKKRLDEIRKQGYKAYLVIIPDDPLSRGHISKGFSVYAEPKFMQDELATCNRGILKGIPRRLNHAKEAYDKAIQEIKDQQSTIEKWMIEHGYSLE